MEVKKYLVVDLLGI